MAINWFKYSSPASFYTLAGKMIPIFVFAAVVLLVAGLYVGFFVAPTDFQQGEAYRIIFIHVPAAWRPTKLQPKPRRAPLFAAYSFPAPHLAEIS